MPMARSARQHKGDAAQPHLPRQIAQIGQIMARIWRRASVSNARSKAPKTGDTARGGASGRFTLAHARGSAT